MKNRKILFVLMCLVCWMFSGGIIYAQECVSEIEETEQGFLLHIWDDNPDWENSEVVVKYKEEKNADPAVIAEMSELVWKEEDERFLSEIKAEEEGIYEVYMLIQDEDGNVSGPLERVKVVDRTEPAVKSVYAYTEERKIEVEDQMIFSNSDTHIKLLLQDAVSGLKQGSLWIREEEQVYERQICEWEDEEEIGEIEFELKGLGCWEFGVVLEDTKGNRPNDIVWIGRCVTENEAPAGEISVSGTKGENDFYQRNVKVELSAKDENSGIRKMKLLVNGETVKSWDGKGVLLKEEVFELDTNLFEGKNQVQFLMEDRAGNQSSREITVKIDGQPPRTELIFRPQKAYNSIYYSEARSAVLVIKEKHFDAERIKIRNGDTLFSSPLFTSGEEEDTYVAEIVFDIDGRYELWIEAVDMAGNASEIQRIEPFIIDTKPPVIHVAYEDGDESGTAFSQPRKAVVRITEANPDFEEMKWEIYRDNKRIKMESPKDWMSFNGSRLKGTVDFEEEGIYKWTVKLTDLAGNISDEWTSEEFLLDFTPPLLEFTGISNGTSINGDARFVIRGTDMYLQKESLQVQVCRDGRRILHKSKTDETENGIIVTFDAIPREDVWEGHYSVEAECRDIAGNYVQDRWTFTINRQGSHLTLGSGFQDMLDQYYVRTASAVCFSERNADALTEKILFLKDENGVKVLEEGKDYTVIHTKEEAGWHLYDYQIDEKIFKRDGLCQISLYTEDRAGNTLDSRIDFPMSFFLDREAPEIFVHSIQENEKSAYEKCLRVIARDLSPIRELRFFLDGKELGSYSEQEIIDAGGVFRVYPKLLEESQEFVVVSVDAAGNCCQTEDIIIEPSKNGERNTEAVEKEEEANDWIGCILLIAGAAVVIIVYFAVRNRLNPQNHC